MSEARRGGAGPVPPDPAVEIEAKAGRFSADDAPDGALGAAWGQDLERF